MDLNFDIDDFDFEEYPYHGCFYITTIDTTVPLDKRVARKELILDTDCDIQRQSARHNGGLLGAGYDIYWPLELNPESTGIGNRYLPPRVKRGMTFEGEYYGDRVVGEVEIVVPSQLGGCQATIKVKTEG